jgi:choline-sulfatase/uncharacterized sulfatase
VTPIRNLLFVLADQLNARYLHHAGHPQVITPNLDRLAAEGTRFSDAVCSSTICTPSRVSFLSGQYSHNHGYYGLFGPKPEGLPSFLGHCRARGFLTAALGKIHCPAHWIEEHTEVFHETCHTSIGGRSEAYISHLGARLPLEDHQRLPEFGDAGRQSMDSRPSVLSFDESQEGWIASETLRQVERAQREGRRFAIHASFPRPHQCTSPCREFWDQYEGLDLQLSPTADEDAVVAGKAPHFVESSRRWRSGNWTLLEPRTFLAARRRKLHGYLAAITQVDAAIGRILERLRSSGLLEQTLVIFGSDHGEYVTSYGIMEKAPGICSDDVTRIPLLFRGPGVAAGRCVNSQVHAVDIAPTVCKQLGLDPMLTADGEDLSPQLGSGAQVLSQERVTVTEFAWSKALRKGRWRLVWYPRGMFPAEFPQGFGELYDLENDPRERRNLWSETAFRPVVADLERELLDWLVTTTRPRTTVGASLHPSLGPEARETYRAFVQPDGRIPGRNLALVAKRNYL